MTSRLPWGEGGILAMWDSMEEVPDWKQLSSEGRLKQAEDRMMRKIRKEG